jgi:hypothetical protein
MDSSVAKWGDRHSSATAMHLLGDITQLGSVYVVIALCVTLAVAETIRERTAWVASFILAVMVGEEGLTLTVKELVNRLRPTFQSGRSHARPLVPQRPFGDGGRLLRDRGASTRTRPSTHRAGRAHRSRSGESPSPSQRAVRCWTCTG